jgi:hypothetical protein
MKAIKIQSVEVLLEEAEKYIQINDIGEGDLLAVWEPLRLRYPGFEVNLCFRDVPVPENTLAAIGAEVLEDCLKMYVTQGEHVPHESPDISLLTKADFGGFAALHDTLPDMWWTSRRIWEKWEGWRIPVLREKGRITGYAMLMVMARNRTLGEVFAVEAADPAHRKALLSASVGCAFENGKTTVLRTVDRDNTSEREETRAVGFCEKGYYIGYRVQT